MRRPYSATQTSNACALNDVDDDVFLPPILQSLQNNSYLETLEFELMYISDVASSSAMQRLLESNTSITQFEFYSVPFCKRLLRPIAQSIIKSQSVSKLSFLIVNLMRKKKVLRYSEASSKTSET